jgi:hypothetical protein
MARSAAIASLFLGVLCLSGCGFAYRVDCDPPDASLSIGGKSAVSGKTLWFPSREVGVSAAKPGFVGQNLVLRHKGLLGVQAAKIGLNREVYKVSISLVSGPGRYLIDSHLEGSAPFEGELPSGPHQIALSPAGYPEQSFEFELSGPSLLRYRAQSDAAAIAKIAPLGIYPCGNAPKQVNFSPDGKSLYISLLEGPGFDILDWKLGARERVEVAGYASARGFVEGLFVPSHSSFFVTQMTRDAIHEFRLPADGAKAPSFVRSLPTGGSWSKVSAYSPSADIIAISNWLSDDVTILDYASGNVAARLKGISIPRGLAFSPDGSRLTVASFGDGRLLRYDTKDWRLTDSLSRKGGALRHVVAASDGSRLFVSDMARSEVLEVDARDFSILHVYATGSNPNTIDLSGDSRILAVSCRGPNNPESYILRSPKRGEVLLFDAKERRLLATLEGGTQPTGLDISDDGKILAFSNFQDADVELYDISRLLAP